MKKVLIPANVIYDVKEEWLDNNDEWLERPAFWIWVKDMSGLDTWRYSSRKDHFYCKIRDKKKATMFILRYL